MAVLNIAALSRRTGVAADTLRKWEHRYGVLQPQRTPGGQRRYTELDVSRVEWLRDRLEEGYRIGEAALLLGDAPVTGRRTAAELRDALVEAVSDSDLRTVEALLDQAFALHRLEHTLTRVVQPALELVGKAWAAGRLTVAQEHLITGAVRARMERLLADMRGGSRGVAVLACVPGERHELGLMSIALLLRADGWQVAYLGADAPLRDVFDLAEQLRAPLVGLSVGTADNAKALRAEVARRRLPSGPEVVVGGAAATVRLARALGARPAGDDVRRTVRELRRVAR